jgi:hypothetical protein
MAALLLSRCSLLRSSQALEQQLSTRVGQHKLFLVVHHGDREIGGGAVLLIDTGLIGHEKGEVFGPGFPKGPHIVGSVWGETGTTTEEDEVIEQCREAGHELLNKRRARDSKEARREYMRNWRIAHGQGGDGESYMARKSREFRERHQEMAIEG